MPCPVGTPIPKMLTPAEGAVAEDDALRLRGVNESLHVVVSCVVMRFTTA